MPKVKYVDFRFSASTLKLIETCNSIIREYQAQGFALTLRQLYYQCVSRDFIPNTQQEYKRLGSIVNDARLAGLIDWDAIEDRTRNLRTLPHWSDPADLVKACSEQFRMDMWATQDYRPEVWIEKDALVGVIEGVCQEFDVPHFSCRGYTSQSEMWVAGQRMRQYTTPDGSEKYLQTPIVFHFGDHDPSGKDMSRDIMERLRMFTGGLYKFERLALNMDQVDQYNPPPNPAKLTDSRCTAYIAEFGASSWELDALEPSVIAGLIRKAITSLIDQEEWDKRAREIKRCRTILAKVSKQWDRVADMMRGT